MKSDPLNEARQLAADGRFEEALQKHVWLHDYVLQEQPSYYGVRLSFALSEWVKLGAKYPKALNVLTEIRANKTARLLNSEHSRDLFHDVMAINRSLKEADATVKLFKQLENSSSAFAAEIYTLADKALVDAGEYALARKYLDDPKSHLESARQHLEEGLRRSTKGPVRDAARRAHQKIFTDDVVRLITILKNSSEAALAVEIQSEALKIFDSSRIREALL